MTTTEAQEYRRRGWLTFIYESLSASITQLKRGRPDNAEVFLIFAQDALGRQLADLDQVYH